MLDSGLFTLHLDCQDSFTFVVRITFAYTYVCHTLVYLVHGLVVGLFSPLFTDSSPFGSWRLDPLQFIVVFIRLWIIHTTVVIVVLCSSGSSVHNTHLHILHTFPPFITTFCIHIAHIAFVIYIYLFTYTPYRHISALPDVCTHTFPVVHWFTHLLPGLHLPRLFLTFYIHCPHSIWDSVPPHTYSWAVTTPYYGSPHTLFPVPHIHWYLWLLPSFGLYYTYPTFPVIWLVALPLLPHLHTLSHLYLDHLVRHTQFLLV